MALADSSLDSDREKGDSRLHGFSRLFTQLKQGEGRQVHFTAIARSSFTIFNHINRLSHFKCFLELDSNRETSILTR